MDRKNRLKIMVVLFAALMGISVSATEWNKKQSPRPAWRAHGMVDAQGVKQFIDVPYYAGADADPVKSKLDLYLPEGKSKFPVVMFIHGGGWDQGDKRVTTDPYGDFGRRFAKKGVGVATIDYRLSPQFKYPTHVQDVARAFAWVKKNIASYGGDPDRIFVSGHSAGGHLTALLSVDERWLKEQGLSLKDIRGAIPISGVYDFNGLKETDKLSKADRIMIDRFLSGDPEKMKDGSPINHIEPGKNIPPFLILWGGLDYPTLPPQAKAFAHKLKDNGYSVKTVQYPLRNHYTMIVDIRNPGDKAQEEILRFIASH
jgi:acetyl esterase/lipase